MTTEERIHIINLRREFLKVAIYKRSKKAVTGIKVYIAKHRKVKLDDVRVGNNLNMLVWGRGTKHPPSKVKVKSIIQDGKAYVELVDFPFDIKPKEEKKEEKSSKKTEAEVVKKEEKKKEDLKALEKEELAELKKEHAHETKEKPDKNLKQDAKTGEIKEKMSKTSPRSGKKDKA